MRVTSCILNAIAAGALLVACGSSSPTQPGEVATFRVMTFNVQHGINGAGKYGLNYAVQTISAIKPDLVGVQELTRNHPSYNCEDQPAKIAEMLSASTGRSWRSVYQQEWFTPDKSCQSEGRGDGAETEGIGFFAPEPVAIADMTQLWNARLGVMTLLRRG